MVVRRQERLTDAEKTTIIQMANDKIPYPQIAKEVNRAKSTIYSFFGRMKAGYEVVEVKAESGTEASHKLTFDEVLNTFSSVEALGKFLILGFMRLIDEKDASIKVLHDKVSNLSNNLEIQTRERVKLQSMYNEMTAKGKVGNSFTIDSIKQRIVPRERV